MENLEKNEWKKRVSADQNAFVLDVRTPEECKTGMQKNAVQLDFLNQTIFSNGIKELDKSKTYYVYCRSGNRSAKACDMMDANGFTTYNLIGGMMAWDGELV